LEDPRLNTSGWQPKKSATLSNQLVTTGVELLFLGKIELERE
jgi:hypothetical protein